MKVHYRSVILGGLCLVLVLFGLLLGRPGAKAPKSQTDVAISSDATNSAKAALKGSLDASGQQAFSVTDQILALLASGNPLDQSKVYRELFPAFIRRDPRAAAALAQSPAAAAWHDDLMATVAQVWTDMSVDDAEKWAGQLPNLTERSMILGDVCFEEANIDPSRAAQILDNTELNSVRREIIVENLAQQWAGKDLSPLIEEVDNLPAGSERDGYFKRIALAESQSSPQLAAQMVAEKIAPGPVQDDAALYVLRQWAKTDMNAAASWADNFPSSNLRDKAKIVLAGNLYGAYRAP